ncbi:hypothetical protein [Stomatohabitans albus]|uniref:hypothetical protein n=1 Tax=Stomatohabitans albus TaxID=3110766 RepID=UPI00300D6D1F
MWNELPLDQYRAQQDDSLREWLSQEVIAYAPYWNIRLADLVIQDVDALREVPAATEDDVAGRGGPGNPALMLTPKEREVRQKAGLRDLFGRARHGTSVQARRDALYHAYKPVHVHEAGVDNVLAIAWSSADLERGLESGRDLAAVLGLHEDDTLINLVPAGPTLDFWGIVHLGRGQRMASLHPRGTGESVLAPARRGFGLLPASVVAVPTYEASLLIERLLDDGVKRPHIHVVLCVGEPPDEGLRAQLATMSERIAGHPVRIQAVWGPAAGRVLYGEPPMAEDADPSEFHGLMTYGDKDIVGLRDPETGEPITQGPGELVITSLGWAGTALVQFATGTRVEAIIEGDPHPYSQSVAPRLVGTITEAAWQPLVSVAPPGIRPDSSTLERPDFRGIRTDIEEALRLAQANEYALSVIHQRLVIQVDRIDRPSIRIATAQIGKICGVEPTIEVSHRLPSGPRRILGGVL